MKLGEADARGTRSERLPAFTFPHGPSLPPRVRKRIVPATAKPHSRTTATMSASSL